MQLRFSRDERTLLLEILQQGESPCRGQTAGAGPTRLGPQHVEDLLDKVINPDLRFASDELENLAEVLDEAKRKVGDEVAGAGNFDQKRYLQARQASLERLRDKVTEACAMG